MKLRIYMGRLSANDADFFVRSFSERGADAKIAFGGGEDHAVLVTQEGPLEEPLKSAEVVFRESSFRLEISN